MNRQIAKFNCFKQRKQKCINLDFQLYLVIYMYCINRDNGKYTVYSHDLTLTVFLQNGNNNFWTCTKYQGWFGQQKHINCPLLFVDTNTGTSTLSAPVVNHQFSYINFRKNLEIIKYLLRIDSIYSVHKMQTHMQGRLNGFVGLPGKTMHCGPHLHNHPQEYKCYWSITY